MGLIEQQVVDAVALRSRVRGVVHVPGEPFYDGARLAFHLNAVQEPAAVVEVACAADVAAVIRYARARGLGVTAQAGGHGSTGVATDTILVRTNHLDAIEVDPERQVARVGAGVRWEGLLAAAGEHGLAGMLGSSADVSVVGYSLGGGLSWFGRSRGVAANAIRSLEVVTADGEIVAADARTNPDLFWAIRGGGGSFGIVTAAEIALHPATHLYGGQLIWPAAEADRVLDAWRRWVETVPERTASQASVINVPPLETVPEPIRGRSIVSIGIVHHGLAVEGEALVSALAGELGPRLFEFMGPLPVPALGMVAMDPPDPMPYVMRSQMLTDVTDEVLGTMVSGVARADSPLIMLQIRHLGGALQRLPQDAGAVGHIPDPFMIYGIGLASDAAASEAVEDCFTDLWREVAPWVSGRRFFNFSGHGDPLADVYDPETLARLRVIRSVRDPDGVLRANHPID